MDDASTSTPLRLAAWLNSSVGPAAFEEPGKSGTSVFATLVNTHGLKFVGVAAAAET